MMVGLENIVLLTLRKKNELRVDMADWEGVEANAHYASFSVDPEQFDYTLHLCACVCGSLVYVCICAWVCACVRACVCMCGRACGHTCTVCACVCVCVGVCGGIMGAGWS